jgi:hypothetical protein
MSDQNFLNESDIDTLTNLLLRSQQSRSREALCLSIGIDPKRLSFLRDSSDADFFLLLIEYLNDIGDQEALCKLCCKELGSIFQKGTYGLFLNELAEKLNCNQEFKQSYPNNKQQTVPLSSSTPSVRVNPFNQLVKNKLITGGTILLIGLTGFSLFNQNKNSNSPSTPKTENLIPHETAANYSGGVGRVNDAANDPDVILYSEKNGQGNSININAATGDGIPNIGFNDGVSGGGETGFNDITSSIVIKRGGWVFYSNNDYNDPSKQISDQKGVQETEVLEPDIYNLDANDNRITSLKRIF